MGKSVNWGTLAIAKLVKENSKELLIDMHPEYFDGHLNPIFKILQKLFSENQKIPTMEVLGATVIAKAPKDQLPIVNGLLTAISNVNIAHTSNAEIVKGLKDKKLLTTMDSQIQALTHAAMSKDVDAVRGVLNTVVEEINISRQKPQDFAEAMEAEDSSKIITTGIEGLDQHLIGMAGLTIVSGASGCVDKDTEFLTPSGWKSISEYQVGDKVLQWDKDGATEFVVPSEFINKPADTFYHLKTDGGVDQVLSPEHRVVYKTSKGNVNVKQMDDLYSQHIKSKEGFKGKFITTFDTPERSGVAYTDDELRLMIAISADGYIDPRGRRQVVLRLKKSEKKERLLALLKACEIPFHRYDIDTGFSSIAFVPPKLTKDLTELWGANEHQLRVINDEFVHWDGGFDKRTGNKRFFTTVKAHADFIQYVMTTCGNTKISIYVDDRVGEEYYTGGKTYIRKSIAYEVSETSIKNVGISTNKKTPAETIVKRKADGERKYCFTVPSSFFVTRRNGNIVITGNSGKSAFLLEAAIGQFLAGHSILFISLELSAQVLGKRLKSAVTGIPFGKIVSNDLTPAEKALITKAMHEFFDRENSFRVVTTPMDSDELLNLIQVEKSLYDIDVAYIDYLNLIGAPKGSVGGWQSLSESAKALHRLSMEIGVVSVSASQTDLEKAPKGGAYPQIRTRGSAELLFSATLLIYLYKPEADDECATENSVVLYVMKNRNSAQCQLLMEADFTYMKYTYIDEL